MLAQVASQHNPAAFPRTLSWKLPISEYSAGRVKIDNRTGQDVK